MPPGTRVPAYPGPMASDHWRDLHRHPSGKFLPRPGKRGFKAPEPDQDEDRAKQANPTPITAAGLRQFRRHHGPQEG